MDSTVVIPSLPAEEAFELEDCSALLTRIRLTRNRETRKVLAVEIARKLLRVYIPIEGNNRNIA